MSTFAPGDSRFVTTFPPPRPSILFDGGTRYVKRSCGHWCEEACICRACERDGVKFAHEQQFAHDLALITACLDYVHPSCLFARRPEAERWLRDYYATEQENSTS